MTKVPVKGQVKSRLARSAGKGWAEGFYRNCVLDILSILDKSPFKTVVSFYPPESLDELASWLGNSRDYIPQAGKDLGERLKNSLVSAFSNGARKAVALASDVPDLPPSITGRSVSVLPEWRDVDTIEDVLHLLNAYRGLTSPCPKTTAYLEKNGHLIRK